MVETVHEEIRCWKHGLRGTNRTLGKEEIMIAECKMVGLRLISTFRYIVVVLLEIDKMSLFQ